MDLHSIDHATFKTGVVLESPAKPYLPTIPQHGRRDSKPSLNLTLYSQTHTSIEAISRLPHSVNPLTLKEMLLSDAPFVTRQSRAFWKKWLDIPAYNYVLSAIFHIVYSGFSDNGTVNIDALEEASNLPFYNDFISNNLVSLLIHENIKIFERDRFFSRLPEILCYMTLNTLMISNPKHHRVYNSVKFREILLDFLIGMICGVKPTNILIGREWLFRDAVDTSIFVITRHPNGLLPPSQHPATSGKNVRSWYTIEHSPLIGSFLGINKSQASVKTHNIDTVMEIPDIKNHRRKLSKDFNTGTLALGILAKINENDLHSQKSLETGHLSLHSINERRPSLLHNMNDHSIEEKHGNRRPSLTKGIECPTISEDRVVSRRVSVAKVELGHEHGTHSGRRMSNPKIDQIGHEHVISRRPSLTDHHTQGHEYSSSRRPSLTDHHTQGHVPGHSLDVAGSLARRLSQSSIAHHMHSIDERIAGSRHPSLGLDNAILSPSDSISPNPSISSKPTTAASRLRAALGHLAHGHSTVSSVENTPRSMASEVESHHSEFDETSHHRSRSASIMLRQLSQRSDDMFITPSMSNHSTPHELSNPSSTTFHNRRTSLTNSIHPIVSMDIPTLTGSSTPIQKSYIELNKRSIKKKNPLAFRLELTHRPGRELLSSSSKDSLSSQSNSYETQAMIQTKHVVEDGYRIDYRDHLRQSMRQRNVLMQSIADKNESLLREMNTMRTNWKQYIYQLHYAKTVVMNSNAIAHEVVEHVMDQLKEKGRITGQSPSSSKDISVIGNNQRVTSGGQQTTVTSSQGVKSRSNSANPRPSSGFSNAPLDLGSLPGSPIASPKFQGFGNMSSRSNAQEGHEYERRRSSGVQALARKLSTVSSTRDTQPSN